MKRDRTHADHDQKGRQNPDGQQEDTARRDRERNRRQGADHHGGGEGESAPAMEPASFTGRHRNGTSDQRRNSAADVKSEQGSINHRTNLQSFHWKDCGRANESQAKLASGKIFPHMKPMSQTPYHHGSLREALLTTGEAAIERDGLDGLTLRSLARAAGVSHAAPAHHFGDLAGLLSEIAAVGYRRFAAALVAAGEEAGPDPKARLRALGRAYVAFARRHPGLFQLMFRSARLDRNSQALREASRAAFDVLRSATGAADSRSEPHAEVGAIAAWSLVHGFAVLLLDDRLPQDWPPGDLLEAVLSHRD